MYLDRPAERPLDSENQALRARVARLERIVAEQQQALDDRRRADAELRESEMGFRQLAEYIDEAFWVVDVRNDRLVYVSPAYQHVWGRSCQSLYDDPHSWIDTVHPDDHGVVQQAIERQRQGERTEAEFRVLWPDGSIRWVWERASPLRDASGEVYRVTGLSADVTARKQAEESIRFQAYLLDIVEQAVVAQDLSGRITYWNRFAELLYGWSAAEALGQCVLDLMLPTHVLKRGVELLEDLRRGKSWAGEFTGKHRDGHTFAAYSTASPIFDQHGQIFGIVAVSMDISERKRAEAVLRESERNLRLIAENTSDVISAYDMNRRLLYVNSAFEELTGYSLRELHERDFIPYLYEDDAERMMALFESTFHGHSFHDAEYRMVTRDGVVKWCSASGGPLRNAAGVQIGVQGRERDITERKQVEESLRASEERYRQIVETTLEGVWVLDSSARTTFVNGQMAAMLGYSVQEMFGTTLFDYLDDEWRAIAASHVERRRQGISERHDFRFRRKDGSDLWAIVSTNPLVDDTGAFIGTLGMLTDITARVQADAALSQAYGQLELLNVDLLRSRDLLRTIFDGLADGLVLLDRDGQVLTANQALATLLGSSIEGLTGMSWHSLCQRTDPPLVSVMETCASGPSRQQRVRLSLPSGQLRILDVETFPVVGVADPIDQLVVHLVDVTEHLQLEAQLIEQERFAASGRLAATVAHEVNTPLQAIESCLHLASRVGAEERGQYLGLARDELHRVSHILRQLLDLYRPSMSADAPLDLNVLIERVLLLTSSSLARQGIAVERELMPEPPPLLGRADALTQMLLNLIFNAIHAMPRGGTLKLRTTAPQTEHEPGGAACSPTRQLVLEVEDSGVGMSAPVQARIFDPFFTTKADGSGLGLAITQKIVSEHQGQIMVRSTPNVGTIFTIVFTISG